MKSVLRAVVVGFSLSVLLTMSSCGDDSADKNNTSTGKLNDATKEKLYDKAWYPTLSSGGANMEFITDGKIYRINKSLDGTWNWKNNGDTMAVVDYSGNRYNFLFESITDNEMKYRYDFAGDNFQQVYTMKDTE